MIRLATTGRDLTRALAESIAEARRKITHREIDALLDVRDIDTPIPYTITEEPEADEPR